MKRKLVLIMIAIGTFGIAAGCNDSPAEDAADAVGDAADDAADAVDDAVN